MTGLLIAVAVLSTVVYVILRRHRPLPAPSRRRLPLWDHAYIAYTIEERVALSVLNPQAFIRMVVS